MQPVQRFKLYVVMHKYIACLPKLSFSALSVPLGICLYKSLIIYKLLDFYMRPIVAIFEEFI